MIWKRIWYVIKITIATEKNASNLCTAAVGMLYTHSVTRSTQNQTNWKKKRQKEWTKERKRERKKKTLLALQQFLNTAICSLQRAKSYNYNGTIHAMPNWANSILLYIHVVHVRTFLYVFTLFATIKLQPARSKTIDRKNERKHKTLFYRFASSFDCCCCWLNIY